MMNNLPITGATYEYYGEEESLFRVIEWDFDNIFYVELKPKQIVLPQIMKLKEFREMLKEGDLKEAADPFENMIEEDSLTLKQLESRDRKWKIVHEIWSDPETRNLFLVRSERRKGFDLLSKKLSVTLQQAKRIMTSFWQKGMTPNALLPQFRKRGKGVQKQGQKTGRKGKSQVAMSVELREQFQKVYRKYYLSGKENIQSTYDELLKLYYRDYIKVEANGKVEKVYSEKCPTIGQFYYWISKTRNLEEVYRRRYGDRAFQNNGRVTHGSSRDQVDGPGSRFELDLTDLNIAVVSRFDRSKIIGYPRLFILVDVYSKMVTGLKVSMENESNWLGAMTIFNSAQDKVAFARDYGVEITEEDWPSHYFPERILYDNGQFKNSLQENFKGTYYIHFEYSPTFSPTSKGSVERKHQSYKDFIFKYLPGAIKSHTRQRGERDNRLDATLTLEELTQIIIRLTVQFNKTPIQDFEMEPEMILAGFKATPVDLWNWGVMNGYGSLKKVTNLKELYLHLLPRIQRKVGQKGIRYRNHFYVGADERARHILNINRDKTVTFCYSPVDVSEGYVFIQNKYYPLQLRLKDNYRYKRLEAGELKFIDDYKRKDSHEDRVRKGMEWSGLKEDVRKVVKEAESKTPEHSHKDLNGIRENKREYLELERAQLQSERKKEDYKDDNRQESRESFSEMRREYLKQHVQRSQEEESNE